MAGKRSTSGGSPAGRSELDGLVCDRCGNGLLLDAPVRYVLTMESRSAYDPLEVTREDLERAEERLRDVLRELEQVSEEEAQDEVYWRKRFDLCATCHQAIVANPFAR